MTPNMLCAKLKIKIKNGIYLKIKFLMMCPNLSSEN